MPLANQMLEMSNHMDNNSSACGNIILLLLLLLFKGQLKYKTMINRPKAFDYVHVQFLFK